MFRSLSAACAALLFTASLAGCGGMSAPEAAAPEDVALIEPVSVGESVEAAARRDMYDAVIYNGIICPYTEEYVLEQSRVFDSYGALPGDEVKKGTVLVYTRTEELNKQIENMEKSMAQKEKDFLKYCEKAEESLAKYREDEKSWGEAVERWEAQEPEEPEEPEEGTASNDEWTASHDEWTASHDAWVMENETVGYERRYRNALIGRQKLEEELRQKTELYQMDAAYDAVLLRRLRKELDESRVISKQKGVVANVFLSGYGYFVNSGYYIDSGESMAAVIDPDRRMIKCDFINKTVISSAEQVFAIIDGKRYEVEYEPMESEEYQRLSEKNKGKVYTTFYLPEEAEEEIGSYALIVIIKQVRRDVISVPKDSIEKSEDSSYVYIYKDGGRVYTPVTTGMQDGVYTEILSGIEEGDLVLTKKEASGAEKTKVLTRGRVGHTFTARGALVYPGGEWITCPDIHGTVYFEEMLVNVYQPVKKGDVLFTIRVKPDEAELARRERELLRKRERLAELEKKPKDNEDQIERDREDIAEMEKLINEMKADYATTQIKAPYDGIITDMNDDLWWNRLKSGDLLWQGRSLVQLAKQGASYVRVEDPNGLLTYGNQAMIEYTSESGVKKRTTGQVVTLNQASISADLFGESGYALIRVSNEDTGEMTGIIMKDGMWYQNTYEITVATREMDNVLLVPKKAVTAYGGTTYVRVKLEDGTTRYQSFLAGGSDDENYWVIEGLTEGMEVCIE